MNFKKTNINNGIELAMLIIFFIILLMLSIVIYINQNYSNNQVQKESISLDEKAVVEENFGKKVQLSAQEIKTVEENFGKKVNR